MERRNYDHWNPGKPPALGWYNASMHCNKQTFRFWDGKQWSDFAGVNYSLKNVASIAKTKIIPPNRICWRHQPEDWPTNAKTY